MVVGAVRAVQRFGAGGARKVAERDEEHNRGTPEFSSLLRHLCRVECSCRLRHKLYAFECRDVVISVDHRALGQF
jgi:hypothetical protein